VPRFHRVHQPAREQPYRRTRILVDSATSIVLLNRIPQSGPVPATKRPYRLFLPRHQQGQNYRPESAVNRAHQEEYHQLVQDLTRQLQDRISDYKNWHMRFEGYCFEVTKIDIDEQLTRQFPTIHAEGLAANATDAAEQTVQDNRRIFHLYTQAITGINLSNIIIQARTDDYPKGDVRIIHRLLRERFTSHPSNLERIYRNKIMNDLQWPPPGEHPQQSFDEIEKAAPFYEHQINVNQIISLSYMGLVVDTSGFIQVADRAFEHFICQMARWCLEPRTTCRFSIGVVYSSGATRKKRIMISLTLICCS